MLMYDEEEKRSKSTPKGFPSRVAFKCEGVVLGPAHQIGLRLGMTLILDKALVLDKALFLDKELDFWIVNPIQRTTSSFPTVRRQVVSRSDNHEEKHRYPTLCE